MGVYLKKDNGKKMSKKNDNISRYAELLAKPIPIRESIPKTFMEIAGYPHYENVVSNILKFYLSPNEDHGLEDLLVKSLLDCINRKRETPFVILTRSLTIEREYPGLNQTRIDLLIISGDIDTDETKAVIIECKIWAELYNNLDHYWDAVEATEKTGVLLSLYPVTGSLHTGFVNITFEEYVDEIEKNLANLLSGGSNKYVLYLHDFLANLSSLKGNKLMSATFNFYYENLRKINELAKVRDEVNQRILDAIVISGESLGYTVTDKRYPDYRCWLVNGRNDVYFCLFNDAEEAKSLNECLTISLFLDQKLVNRKDDFIKDPVLKDLALKNKFRLGVIFKHGSFIQIMKREYPLNASFLENIEQELVQIDRQILGSVAKRVTELL